MSVERALNLITNVYHDKTDNDGYPSLFHPLAVASKFNPFERPYLYQAALLHDVVEDTHITPNDIRVMFAPEVYTLVMAVTRRDGEEYAEYIDRVISEGPNAITLKLADLESNMFHRALTLPAGLKRRYERAHLKLTEAMIP